MNEEWGTPISKEKIISRRNRLIEYQKTQDMRFTVGYQIIDENILDINYMIYEIERLNNIINKGIEAINIYQNEKTLSVGYQDLKRIRGILQGNEFDLQMFEEYLKELGEKNENE